MKEDIKNRWVDALKSGEYTQTLRVLHDKDGFCCLGLLSELHRQETGGNWERFKDGGSRLYLGEGLVLPDDVKDWAGIKTETGTLPETYPELPPNDARQGSSSQLSGLNDRGYSFAQLGEIIEKHWKFL